MSAVPLSLAEEFFVCRCGNRRAFCGVIVAVRIRDVTVRIRDMEEGSMPRFAGKIALRMVAKMDR